MLFTNLFSIFGLLTAFSRVSFSLKRDWKYVANTNLDDRVCDTVERLVSDSARHAIECGVFCTQVPGCYSFFFNTVTKECRGCDRTYNQWSPTLAAAGMKYFGMSTPQDLFRRRIQKCSLGLFSHSVLYKE